MLSAADEMGRPFIAPRNTPAELLKTLRDAFGRAVAGPSVKEEAKQVGMTAVFTPENECLRIVNYVLNQPETVVRSFSKYVKF